jgi:hypothetical protein
MGTEPLVVQAKEVRDSGTIYRCSDEIMCWFLCGGGCIAFHPVSRVGWWAGLCGNAKVVVFTRCTRELPLPLYCARFLYRPRLLLFAIVTLLGCSIHIVQWLSVVLSDVGCCRLCCAWSRAVLSLDCSNLVCSDERMELCAAAYVGLLFHAAGVALPWY